MSNIKWSNHEKMYIQKNAAHKTDQELTKELIKMTGRTVTLASVRKLRQRLNIKKKSGRGKCELQ